MDIVACKHALGVVGSFMKNIKENVIIMHVKIISLLNCGVFVFVNSKSSVNNCSILLVVQYIYLVLFK
jgi:hypothetical protein